MSQPRNKLHRERLAALEKWSRLRADAEQLTTDCLAGSATADQVREARHGRDAAAARWGKAWSRINDPRRADAR